jgi:hypothetical protein
MEKQDSFENQSVAVANLAQCYNYKGQLAGEKLDWRPPLSILLCHESILHLFSLVCSQIYVEHGGDCYWCIDSPRSFAQFF